MRSAFHTAVILFTATCSLSCGGDSTSPAPTLTIASLVGSWTATSVTFTNTANPAETFEVVAAGGEVRFTMLAGGDTRIWVDIGGLSDEWDSAVTLSGDIMTVDPVEAGRPTRVWKISLVNQVLTMTDVHSTFDFTQAGAPPVSATEVIVFVRN